jgi:hypothetical protein
MKGRRLLPYWVLFAVFAAGSLQYQRQGVREQNPLLLLAGLCLVMVIGLRYAVGGDWVTYNEMLDDIYYLSLSASLTYTDPGYAFFNWMASRLGFDIWFPNLLCALVFTWGLIRFARSQPNPWLAVLVALPYLVIVVAMGYTRQAVAIGLVMAGLTSLKSGSIVRFAFYIFAAVLFHKSAIIVLPLVTLAAARNKLVIYLTLILLTACLYYLFIADRVEQVVSGYIDSSYQSEGAGIRAGMNLIPALIFLRYQKHLGLSMIEEKFWRNVSWAVLFSFAVLMVSSATTFVDRLALYLIPLQIMVLSRAPYAFKKGITPNGQVLIAVILYSALIQFVWLNYATNADAWLPYQFYPTANKAEQF